MFDRQIDLKKELIGVEWEIQLSLPEFSQTTVLSTYADERTPFSSAQKFKILDHHPAYAKSDNPTKGLTWIFCNFDYLVESFKGSFIIDIPMNNFEIRSTPTNLNLFSTELRTQEQNLFNFLRDLDAYTKSGIGVFFPKSKYGYSEVNELVDGSYGNYMSSMHGFLNPLSSTRPSKHVNISFCEPIGILDTVDQNELYYSIWINHSYTLNIFKTYILLKTHDMKFHSARLHVTVPYNFDEYKVLVEYAKGIWMAPNFESLVLSYKSLMNYVDGWAEARIQIKPILVGYIKNHIITAKSGLI